MVNSRFVKTYDEHVLSYEFNNKCCCDSGCCWNKCALSKPPKECLEEIAMGQWIFNESLGYYQALVIETGDTSFFLNDS